MPSVVAELIVPINEVVAAFTADVKESAPIMAIVRRTDKKGKINLVMRSCSFEYCQVFTILKVVIIASKVGDEKILGIQFPISIHNT